MIAMEVHKDPAASDASSERTGAWCWCLIPFVLVAVCFGFWWQLAISGTPLSTGWLSEGIVSVLPPECASLASSGIVSDSSIMERYIAMHRHSVHVLKVPPPHSNYFLNVPAKSGNHNWRGLFYRLWLGEAPLNFSQVEPVSEQYTQNEKSRLLSPDQHVWLLVRNPYVRLLSVYLEKVRCSREPLCETTHRTDIGGECFYYKESHMFRNYGSLTFEQYVIALTNHILFDNNRGTPQLSAEFMEVWVRSGSRGNDSHYMQTLKEKDGFNWIKPVHFWGDSDVHYESHLPDVISNPYPCAERSADSMMSLIDPTGRVRRKDFPGTMLVTDVERAYRLCTSDHHTCVQSSGMLKQQPGRVKVLRLEEQEQWYTQLLQCFGISKEQVVGEEWRSFEKQDCFYTPTGNCSDALKVINKTELTSGGLHGHDTVSIMLDHYTPLAAELAYFLYKYDFDRLGYKKWDGMTEFVPL